MNPHWSMAISAEHMSKFAALHQQCLLLQMSEKFSQWDKTPNKQSINMSMLQLTVNVLHTLKFNVSMLHSTVNVLHIVTYNVSM